MHEQVLRGLNLESRVLPPERIHDLGFGFSEITSAVAPAAILSRRLRRRFLLMCGCIVSQHDECGAICLDCRREIEEQLSDTPCAHGLLPQHIDWLATPCVRHTLRCSYPLCDRAGCLRHMAVSPLDGRPYCKEHFLLLADDHALAELGERTHKIVPGLYRLLRACFIGLPEK